MKEREKEEMRGRKKGRKGTCNREREEKRKSERKEGGGRKKEKRKEKEKKGKEAIGHYRKMLANSLF